jgi:membrane-associated protease RseP (regulator of RpoE activity)
MTIAIVALLVVAVFAAHGAAHYWAARRLGARVRLVSALIPVTGCAHVATRTRDLRPWKHAAVCLVGPAASYLVAAALGFLLLSSTGALTGTVWYLIADTEEGTDARGKLAAGDRILRVGDELVYDRYAGMSGPPLMRILERSRDELGNIDVTVLRAGAEMTFSVTPSLEETWHEGQSYPTYRLGILLNPHGDEERVALPLDDAIGQALMFPAMAARAITAEWVDGIAELVGGRSGELVGPVGVTTTIHVPPRSDWPHLLEQLTHASAMLMLLWLLLDAGLLVWLSAASWFRARSSAS